MGDLPAHAIGGVDFKIDPTVIDSITIRKLETITHGSGGFSDVRKCSMSTPSGTHTVAVKCIRVANANDKGPIQTSGKRIRREAYVWITLSHNHILPFLGITMIDFVLLPALVSPWMENGSLNNYLKREFPQLSDHQKLELIRQVAAGLCYLHEEKSIVHGDLTAFSVLVDDTGKLRIAGFELSMPLAEADDVMFNSMDTGHVR
ncbi:kinase-like protein [Rhizopogon salebrosus TDB-379]|nr:kinase-like protein [Rhizopogon salebrosus TDB-379]